MNRTIVGKPADQAELKNLSEAIKDWIETGEDQYKYKFESALFIKSLKSYLYDNEMISNKDFKMTINKKDKEFTITRNIKVQKVEDKTEAKPELLKLKMKKKFQVKKRKRLLRRRQNNNLIK